MNEEEQTELDEYLDEYLKNKENEICEDFEFLQMITKRMIKQELQEINEKVKELRLVE